LFLGVHTFTGTSDDGQRLYIGGSLVFNDWVDQGATSASGMLEGGRNLLFFLLVVSSSSSFLSFKLNYLIALGLPNLHFFSTGTYNMQAGQSYSIVYEYYERAGLAVTSLSWSVASSCSCLPQQIIPMSQLTPASFTIC
jgi:hypothetical protein